MLYLMMVIMMMLIIMIITIASENDGRIIITMMTCAIYTVKLSKCEYITHAQL